MMRVAALYDIHANLPALEAVLEDVRQANVDRIVIGGDVVPGPMPKETIAYLLDLDIPVQFLYGNGELGILAQMRATDPTTVTYWGTSGDYALPEPFREILRWTARQLPPEYEPLLGSWPDVIRLHIQPLGDVLFCHATPRSETEIFTKHTPEERLRPIFTGLGIATVVCGHTHMQFDRMVGDVRVVNAGSVGMPFGEPGADWLLLGPDIQLRHTMYDLASAAERIRRTKYPMADDFAARNVLSAPSAEETLKAFSRVEVT
jgi:predicted phosphodiesterase